MTTTGWRHDPDVTVVELAAADTHDLRRSVLRSGTLTSEVRFDVDDLPSTFHLGIRQAERIVAISTWAERRHPDHPQFVGAQLRGMATAIDRHGSGLGSRLLTAGLERCARDGVELVWARARDTALEFYLRHGFETFGRGYTDLATGLAHHDVVRRL